MYISINEEDNIKNLKLYFGKKMVDTMLNRFYIWLINPCLNIQIIFIDEFSNIVYIVFNFRKLNLKALTQKYLEKEVDKSKDVQCSDWDCYTLSSQQVSF